MINAMKFRIAYQHRGLEKALQEILDDRDQEELQIKQNIAQLARNIVSQAFPPSLLDDLRAAVSVPTTVVQIDKATEEKVHYLFSYRGKLIPMSLTFLSDTLVTVRVENTAFGNIQEAYEKVIELLVEIHKTSPVGKRYGE